MRSTARDPADGGGAVEREARWLESERRERAYPSRSSAVAEPAGTAHLWNVETTARSTQTGQRGDVLSAGCAAGLLAAVAMILFMAAVGAWDGGDALGPLRAVGSTFRGQEALAGGAGTIAWGVLLHLVVGAVLGTAFAAIVPSDMPLHSSVVLGAGCALVVMSFAIPVVVPRLSPVLAGQMPVHGGAWVIAHALFGAVAGIGPALRGRVGAGRRARRRDAPVLRPRTS